MSKVAEMQEKHFAIWRNVDIYLHKPVDRNDFASWNEMIEHIKANDLVEQHEHVANDVVDGGEVWVAELLAQRKNIPIDEWMFKERSSGINGGTTVSDSTFTGSNFQTDLVAVGDILHIHGASNSGFYYVESITSETALEIHDPSTDKFATASNQAYAIYKGAIAGSLGFICLGTSNAAITQNQVDLVAAIDEFDASQEVSIEFLNVGADNKFKVYATYPTTAPSNPPHSIEEAAIFAYDRKRVTPASETDAANRMFNRTLTNTITKTGSFQLTMQWTIEIGSLTA